MKTLPKAQRTRGSSSSYQSNYLRSYQKFKHKSWSHFIFLISTKHQQKISTKHQHLHKTSKKSWPNLASESRNAQLSLLDLVFILFRHHKHIWSFNHCSNNAIWARVVQLFVSCDVNWSSAGHPSSVTKELHIEVLQSMVASDFAVVKSIIIVHSCEFLL